MPRIAALLAHVGPDERTWYLVTSEFTLYAIRNPKAAARLADHDARLREEAAALLGPCWPGPGCGRAGT